MAAHPERLEAASLFVLHNKLHRHIGNRLKALDLGLTVTGLLVLDAIGRAKEPQCRTRSSLASGLGLTGGSMSVLVGRLEAMNLLAPDTCRLDDKSVPLLLTKEGQESLERGHHAWHEATAAWFSALTADTRAAFFRAIGELDAAYDERAIKVRQKKYLRGISKQKTRSNVLRKVDD